MGGSQLNAVELAAAAARQGHDVLVYAPDGILAHLVDEAGLERIRAVRSDRFSSNAVLRLTGVVKQRGIDLVHAYEWAPCVEAAFGAGLRRNTPVLMSVMAMEVPQFLPTHLPITVGTPALAAEEGRRRSVHLLEPPVDMERNRSSDVVAARARWGVGPGELVISVVSMLTTELEKLQGVLAVIAVAHQLAEHYPVRLLIAGDGEGYRQACRRAERVNAHHQRTVVQLLGYQEDPTQVYDAAHVVIGMGGSAIRGMAFGKPLIVQGAAGFWQVLTPTSAHGFVQDGWFGDGGRGARDLKDALLLLLGSPTRRRQLGSFGRMLVEDRYGLDGAGRNLASIYEEVADRHVTRSAALPSLTRSAVEVLRFRHAMRAGNVVRRERWSRAGVQL
ncbi:glycosyltransferase [Arthrobacter agilis]|uniref:glycosyltransferase n=1 Tax=Arthrobacter agilis TaxID=37921 RepID=UPI002365CCC2|nr:glycosyltransferase [Arthrobacter agilis]WDF34223.1 glycosyltransferase [Arthrobacter agilis]